MYVVANRAIKLCQKINNQQSTINNQLDLLYQQQDRRGGYFAIIHDKNWYHTIHTIPAAKWQSALK